eukprot:TRINITY_DN11722_c0_g1_i1.p1 TRINITY_DN11722_c0_g1~~TRINITY_DN11722_c0_g1_i1.p1  ORF type:complete len:250 (-),score=1.98 TRINITY_DN11722_c0_g1_i1:137-886(-)
MATSASGWPSYGSRKLPGEYSDIEAGAGGAVFEDPSLRWAFVRKVYGILSFQLLLTFAVATVVVTVDSVRLTVLHSPLLVISSFILPFILICALSAYHQSHPTNLVLLTLFSLCFSVSLGCSCAYAPAPIVLEALLLTAVVVVSLTLFTFWAASRGYEFGWLGPALFASLSVLVLAMIVQLFFPFGSIGHAIISTIGTILFSLYIVYDTESLLRRFSYDEYIWASLNLYLDILNLFMFLLDLLQSGQGD